VRRTVRIAVVVVLWAPIFAFAGHVASGLGPNELPGFNMGAMANAAQWAFNSPSLGIPAEPTGEFDVAHTEVTLKSGPVAYALGSVAWPGQVAAALPSFLQGQIENGSGGQFQFPVPIPNYPIRAESFYPQGPTRANSQAGTIVMDSSAQAASSEAAASINTFGVTSVVKVGSHSSMAANGFDAEGAVSMVRSAANDISAAGGILQIDSVVSTITARSDGDKGTVAGTTTVLGATVQGHGVVIDSSGVHVEGQGTGTAAAQQAVNAALKNAGVSVELAAPVDEKSGAAASRTLPGLVIKVNDFALDAITSGSFTADQEILVSLAQAQANASASKAFTIPTDTTIGGFTPPVDVGGTNTTTTITEGSRGGDIPSGSSGVVSQPSNGVTLASAPTIKDFNGIPVAIMVLLVLVAFATSRPLMAAADRLLFGRGAAGCPEGLDR
jgi:hypothetical protein